MIAVVGLSHKSAPIDVRERIALPREELAEWLPRLASGPVREALVISTCNRVELVAAAGPAADASTLGAVRASLEAALERRAPGIGVHVYKHQGPAALAHVFRVAASLDSLVLGEPQILGQLKDAFELARRARTLGPALHRVVPAAIRAAKRVRSETALGAGQVSVPSVALDLTRQIFGELQRRVVVLLGSGEMAETVAKLLGGAGARVLVVGRNAERVAEVAALVGGEGRRLDELDAALVEADVVVTSTSAPGYVVTLDQVQRLRRARRGRSLFFIDLAVPRDVDPRVDQVDGVFSYNVDDLSQIVEEGMGARAREASRAEQLIAAEVADFERWADAASVTPLVVALRGRVERVLQAELSRSLRGKLRHLGEEDRGALVRMLEAATNKLLHEPTVRLRRAATDREGAELPLDQLVGSLSHLFALPEGDTAFDDQLPFEDNDEPSDPLAAPLTPEEVTRD